MGMGVPVTGFEVTEPVERGSQGTCCVDTVIIVEVETGKGLGNHIDDTFNGFFEFVVARAWITISCLVQTRAGQNGLAPRPADRSHGFIARHADRRFAQGCRQLFATPQAEQAQKILITLDMAVERRLAYPEFFGYARERERVETLGVC